MPAAKRPTPSAPRAADAKAPEPESKTPAKRGSVEERLRTRLRVGTDAQTDRVKNKAIPYNALDVHDFPAGLDYDWVPAPGGLSPAMHSAPEMANRRAEYVQKGWQFYPADEFGSDPDSGLPWMSLWDDDNGKVRSLDHWLMYIDKDAEERKRKLNNERWNRRRAQRREDATMTDASNRTKGVIESERGQVRLTELLSEDKE